MAKIVVNDLERNDELDREAMRTITGGFTNYSSLLKTDPIRSKLSFLGPYSIDSIPYEPPEKEKDPTNPLYQENIGTVPNN